ncbi:hypothetical protein QA612_00365 [Evansella sp. AB-P1]|uniref:hypothetical protein n=1 Tax=Evansella sp. AB-P1 TaxID=3037653 RepID=UPI00241CA3E2|nr:hypothetical protein [Evansella sp. AB-P1]MDG5785923.1 hypothetical protein [Evansella sp. AB-P1]
MPVVKALLARAVFYITANLLFPFAGSLEVFYILAIAFFSFCRLIDYAFAISPTFFGSRFLLKPSKLILSL